MVPTRPEDYALPGLSEAASQALGLTEGDPMVASIREQFLKAGASQGAFDDFMSMAGKLAEAGLFGSGPIDFKAETAKLGETGPARQREIEVLAQALKERGDGFDDDMYGELMSLAPTAAGVRLVEYLRKASGDGLRIDPPSGAPATDPKEAARAMARDARYATDPDFRKKADEAWQQAFKGVR